MIFTEKKRIKVAGRQFTWDYKQQSTWYSISLCERKCCKKKCCGENGVRKIIARENVVRESVVQKMLLEKICY